MPATIVYTLEAGGRSGCTLPATIVYTLEAGGRSGCTLPTTIVYTLEAGGRSGCTLPATIVYTLASEQKLSGLCSTRSTFVGAVAEENRIAAYMTADYTVFSDGTAADCALQTNGLRAW